MDEVTTFRGMAGEVVRGFLQFATFLTIIPIILFWIFFYFILYNVGSNMPNYIFLILNICAASLLLARFAIPASRGELRCGIFNVHIKQGETLGFVARYLLYTLFWIVPTSLIAYYLFHSDSLLSLILSTGFTFSGASIYGLLMAMIMLISIFGPTICSILATQTTSIDEVFSLEPISWLFHDRRQDLGTFYASILGGITVFFAKYLIPLLIIDLLAFKISFEAGASFSVFIYTLPVLVSPILIGRLSGAFVAGEDSLSAAQDPSSQNFKNVSSSDPEVRKAAATSFAQQSKESYSPEDKKKFERLLSDINNLSPEQLNEWLLQSEKSTSSVYILLQLSVLYKKVGRIEEALAKANEAFIACLNSGMGYEAVQLYKCFSKEKSQLKLAPAQLQLLAAHLNSHKLFMDAAWCYLLLLTSIEDKEEKLGIQKKFLAMAGSANQANQTDMALNLYKLFIEQCPDSTLIEYAKKEYLDLEEKVKKSQ